MKKTVSRLVSFWILAALLVALVPGAAASETLAPCLASLPELIKNPENCRYVQMMLGYYLRNDAAVRETLREGYSAVFLFEGCSDNMDDPELSDITYYRVSAVCLALKLDEAGEPYLSYFNGDCSTLPDRPLEYGAWSLEDVGEVGPATICDGTYELYSVRHGGAYEALQVMSEYSDDTLPAVYMTPEGYVTARADKINIHTRNVNHTIQGAMWSAGCILIGDGDFGKFTELMESTYYAVYDSFGLGEKVGTVTLNRQYLKEEMYGLYENNDAVNMLLANSRHILPETYLARCTDAEVYEERKILCAAKDTELMTLPCSNSTDARSVPLASVEKGEELEIVGSLTNTAGNLWYEINWNGQRCYLYSGYAVEPGWFTRLLRRVFG